MRESMYMLAHMCKRGHIYKKGEWGKCKKGCVHKGEQAYNSMHAPEGTECARGVAQGCVCK